MLPYNQYAIIILKKGRGKLVLCAYDTKNKTAYQLDQEGNQTNYQFYDFVVDHYPDSDEIGNYLLKNKI